RPKGLVELGGRRILDRVVDAVAAVTGAPPLLVANAPEGPGWRPDLRTVPDVRRDCGSRAAFTPRSRLARVPSCVSRGTCPSSRPTCYAPWWRVRRAATPSFPKATDAAAWSRCPSLSGRKAS